MPYDWKSEQAKDTELNQVMKAVNDKYCRCNTGSVAVIGGYHGFGTTTDYMYEKQRAKYVYTWEVFGDLKVRSPTRTKISGFRSHSDRWLELSLIGWLAWGQAHNDDCFRMFNPVTAADYEDNVNRWAAAALTLAAEVIKRELGLDVDSLPASPAAAATAPQPKQQPQQPTAAAGAAEAVVPPPATVIAAPAV